MNYQLITGDSLDILKTLQSESVQCVVTSPPYFGLRDYGSDKQIGLEQSPVEYVNKLVLIFCEVYRILKTDGTLWLNLGDSYIGGKGRSGSSGPAKQELRHSRGISINRAHHTIGGGGILKATDNLPLLRELGIKPKDLIGIPWLVAFALRNAGWYLRQDIIWAKGISGRYKGGGCMPESVQDRCTKAHEYIFLLTKSAKYYYNYEAIKEDSIDIESIKGKRPRSGGNRRGVAMVGTGFDNNPENYYGKKYPKRNRRSVWHINSTGYKGGVNKSTVHFATYPPALIEPCILAGSKKGDVILDPFSGSGTTGEVALKHGRKYIGIELNPQYIKISHERLSSIK